MNEGIPKENEKERLAGLFSRVEVLFNKLAHETESDRRMMDTTDRNVFLYRIKTSAQDAFLVTLGEFFYYLSKNGVEYVRVPDIQFRLGDNDRVAQLRNSYQEIEPKEKLEVTERMVYLTEWAYTHRGFLHSKALPKARFVGDSQS